MNITETQITTLPLAKLVNNNGQIAGVPKNPRTITSDKFRALVERLKANNLTGVNPLKVYEQGGKFVVLGGNQRLRALRELKAESVPCIIVPQDTAAEILREIVILDNTNDGENDWDALANEWEQDELKEWGVDAANWEQPQETQDTAADEDEEDTDEGEYIGEREDGEQYLVELKFALKFGDYNNVVQRLKSIAADKNAALIQLAK